MTRPTSMTRVIGMSAFLLAANGCTDGHQASELNEDPTARALTYLGAHIRSENPSERIVIDADICCGFPGECTVAGNHSSWPTAVLDGAAKELRANIVIGALGNALAASTADLVVAFGPIRSVLGDSLKIVVRYEWRERAIITRVSMSRIGPGWSVDRENILSTATYGDTVYIR